MRRRILTSAATGLLGTSLFMASCGGESKPTPSPSAVPTSSTARCTAYGEWGPVPANFNAPNMAQKIGHGTTAFAVQQGIMGQVHCNPGYEGAKAANAPVTEVAGLTRLRGVPQEIGAHCLLVIVQGDGPPQAGKIYTDFGAVCPNPQPSPLPTAS